jgi:hypothetical protein
MHYNPCIANNNVNYIHEKQSMQWHAWQITPRTVYMQWQLGRRLSTEDARAAFASMDRDGNGSLDLDEWRTGARVAAGLMRELSAEEDGEA